MLLTITAHSPEAGWPPFLEWLTDNGLDPTAIYQMEFDVDTLTAKVHEYALRDGKKYAIGNEMAREAPRVVAVASPPPTR